MPVRSLVRSAPLLLLLCYFGCSSGPVLCTPATGQSAKLVLDSIALPTGASNFAIDLDGDGQPDNRLLGLVAWLSIESIRPRDAIDQSLASGALTLLIEERADNLDDSECGEITTWIGAQPSTPPAYDGHDVFTVDDAIPSGTIVSAITGGTFDSEPPFRLHANNQIDVQLALFPGGRTLPLDLSAAHIQFQRSDGKIVGGQIHGAIANSDLQNTFLPAVAQSMAANTRARRLVDVGDGKGHPCENSDGTESAPGDGEVGVCEVVDNLLLGLGLKPDVQLFARDGSYHPTPHSDHPDSMSIGFGFTAVPASF